MDLSSTTGTGVPEGTAAVVRLLQLGIFISGADVRIPKNIVAKPPTPPTPISLPDLVRDEHIYMRLQDPNPLQFVEAASHECMSDPTLPIRW